MSPPWLTLLSLIGCNNDPDERPAPDDPEPAFVCQPGAPSPTPTRRLSHDQYARTVDAAIELLGGRTLDEAIGARVRELVARVPDDSADLIREDQAVTQLHAEQWYLVAEAVADGVREHHALDCAEADCVPQLVEALGSRLLRRPLSEEEQRFFVDEVYATAPSHADGLRDLVLVWLASPMFAHQIEHGDPDAPSDHPDTVRLTSHELASRLSLHAWNAPPDDELWALAESGALLDPGIYREQVDRLFDDPRSQIPREEFFVGWLQLDELPALDQQIGQRGFDAFRGALQPTADLHQRVARDTLDLLEWHVRDASGLEAIWTAPLHTVMDPEVGALYGVDQLWDGESPPEALQTGHGGLLTRPAFHVTGTTSTRPIHKGVLIRRRVLCDTLGDPPADLGPEPEIDERASQRVRTEQLTEVQGTICAGCHASINGLGYTTEAFDGLGRFRTEEQVYDTSGDRIATWPIDDHAVAQVEWGDDRVLEGHTALAEALAASDKPAICIARFWFRHTWGRAEDDAVDGCVLQDVQLRLEAGDSLDAAMRASALSGAFQQRRFDEGGDE